MENWDRQMSAHYKEELCVYQSGLLGTQPPWDQLPSLEVCEQRWHEPPLLTIPERGGSLRFSSSLSEISWGDPCGLESGTDVT